MTDLKFPEDLKYTQSDEWVRLEGDIATIGLSDYAQNALNDIVYIELPGVGDNLDAGGAIGSVESVKAASDIYSMVGGEVTAVNEKLESAPELINSDPYGEGWIVKLKISGSLPATLMDAAAYQKYCEDRE
ncbi:MAG: glycine cleavage system protein GcvH [Anaerolineae bacterium]|nr:glycine cleavage system protein GcvH [Anaerolineae bacterium]